MLQQTPPFYSQIILLHHFNWQKLVVSVHSTSGFKPFRRRLFLREPPSSSTAYSPSSPMAAGLSAAVAPKPSHLFLTTSHLSPKPRAPFLLPPAVFRNSKIQWKIRRKSLFTVCVLVEDQNSSGEMENLADEGSPMIVVPQIPSPRVAEKLARKRSERFTYLVAAVMSSFGITSMAVMAVYYRFYWQMEVLISLSLSILKLKLFLFPLAPSSFWLNTELRLLNLAVCRAERFLSLRCLVHFLSPLALLYVFDFVSSTSLLFPEEFNSICRCLIFRNQFEIIRSAWSFGRDGLIGLSGTLPCGICTRFLNLLLYIIIS